MTGRDKHNDDTNDREAKIAVRCLVRAFSASKASSLARNAASFAGSVQTRISLLRIEIGVFFIHTSPAPQPHQTIALQVASAALIRVVTTHGLLSKKSLHAGKNSGESISGAFTSSSGTRFSRKPPEKGAICSDYKTDDVHTLLASRLSRLQQCWTAVTMNGSRLLFASLISAALKADGKSSAET